MAPALQQPTVVVIGVKKAGTTSLFEYLAQHRDICPADVKATNYFTPLRLGETHTNGDYARYWASYGGQAYRLEASSTYFYGGKRVAAAMLDTIGDVRTVVSLREPAARMWSEYLMKRRAGHVHGLGFDDYIDACVQAYREGTVDSAKGFASFARGCYADYVGDWLELFGDRLRITWFEQWSRDPMAAMRDLARWLGIDEEAPTTFDYSIRNAVVRYRSPVLARMSISAFRAGRPLLNRDPRVKRALKAAHGRVNADATPERITPAARERLQRLYAEANSRLADQLAAYARVDNLPEWVVRWPPGS